MSEEEMLDIIDRIIINNSLTYFGYNTVQVGYEALEKIVKQYKEQQKEIENLKELNRKLKQCHFRYEEMTGIDLLLED